MSVACRIGCCCLLALSAGCGAGSMVSQSGGSSQSSAPPPILVRTDVTTFKYDASRSGEDLTESVLSPADVNAQRFGLLHTFDVDGKVDAQPLYLSQLPIGGTARDVVFIATENDSVYAFAAGSGALVWHVTLVPSGETPSDDRGCSQITPTIGITSTPVIDREAGPHGAIFVVAMTKDASGGYHQRLYALDVTTGTELPGSPVEIAATYGSTTFSPGQYAERAALLLENGTLYTSFTSHCDAGAYGGWIIAYDETTLAQSAVLNVAPGATGSGFANQGPSIWMSGAGPAADSSGNLYVLTGNGRFETTLDSGGFPSGGDYGNSFVKVTTGGGGLAVADYFTMSNEVAESSNDEDLGSGGVLLLPDETDAGGTVRHLAVGAGKDGNLYVVNRDSLGKFNTLGNNIWQELDGVLPGGVFASPAYFNGTVYYGPVGGPLMAFSISSARLSSLPVSQTATTFVYPGTSPVVSANGTANGIVWAYENTDPAVLHAYDATNLGRELYNSSQAPNGRDRFGAGNKFIVPTVADGRVFVASTTSVAEFGLLP